MTNILKDEKRHATARAFSYARYNSPHQLYNPEDPSTWFGAGRASRGEELTSDQLDQEWTEHTKARCLQKARGRAAQKRTTVQTKTEVQS
jgi:hypothetical protein